MARAPSPSRLFPSASHALTQCRRRGAPRDPSSRLISELARWTKYACQDVIRTFCERKGRTAEGIFERTLFFSAPRVEEYWGLGCTAPGVQPDVSAGLDRGSFLRAWYRA